MIYRQPTIFRCDGPDCTNKQEGQTERWDYLRLGWYRVKLGRHNFTLCCERCLIAWTENRQALAALQIPLPGAAMPVGARSSNGTLDDDDDADDE